MLDLQSSAHPPSEPHSQNSCITSSYHPKYLLYHTFQPIFNFFKFTFLFGPSRGNRTPIHGLEDHCPIRWTIDRLIFYHIQKHSQPESFWYLCRRSRTNVLEYGASNWT